MPSLNTNETLTLNIPLDLPASPATRLRLAQSGAELKELLNLSRQQANARQAALERPRPAETVARLRPRFDMD